MYLADELSKLVRAVLNQFVLLLEQVLYNVLVI